MNNTKCIAIQPCEECPEGLIPVKSCAECGGCQDISGPGESWHYACSMLAAIYGCGLDEEKIIIKDINKIHKLCRLPLYEMKKKHGPDEKPEVGTRVIVYYINSLGRPDCDFAKYLGDEYGWSFERKIDPILAEKRMKNFKSWKYLEY